MTKAKAPRRAPRAPVFEIAGAALLPSRFAPALRGFLRQALGPRLRGRRILLSFVDGPTLRRTHGRFLGSPSDTDVITFPYGGRRASPFPWAEIVISVDAARKAAARLRIPLSEELARYALHGLLHLLGHSDKSPAARARMCRAQEGALRKWLA